MPRLADEIARKSSFWVPAQLLVPLSQKGWFAENQDAIKALPLSTRLLAKQCHDRERLISLAEPHFIGQHHTSALLDQKACQRGPYSMLLRFMSRS
jgi:hypothetical protein